MVTLVLPVDRSRRLLALHHRLEAVLNHEGRGAKDVTATLNLALKASGLDQAKVIHRPRLLSDNGSSYISADLAKWLDGQNMEHVRGAPYHPMTQGKIERWHQTLKNRILLEHYYLPGDLEAQRPSSPTTITGAITRASPT
jgi:transposase InsO family protein